MAFFDRRIRKADQIEHTATRAVYFDCDECCINSLNSRSEYFD